MCTILCGAMQPNYVSKYMGEVFSAEVNAVDDGFRED